MMDTILSIQQGDVGGGWQVADEIVAASPRDWSTSPPPGPGRRVPRSRRSNGVRAAQVAVGGARSGD